MRALAVGAPQAVQNVTVSGKVTPHLSQTIQASLLSGVGDKLMHPRRNSNL